MASSFLAQLRKSKSMSLSMGNGRKTVSKELFRKRELTEFCGKLGGSVRNSVSSLWHTTRIGWEELNEFSRWKSVSLIKQFRQPPPPILAKIWPRNMPWNEGSYGIHISCPSALQKKETFTDFYGIRTRLFLNTIRTPTFPAYRPFLFGGGGLQYIEVRARKLTQLRVWNRAPKPSSARFW